MTPQALQTVLARPWTHGECLTARDLRFHAPVVLDGMTLCSFDLSGAIFEQGLSARGAVFRGMAWLKGAQVTNGLDLRGAVFRTDLRLDALVADSVRLTQARCEGVIDLDGARLGTLYLDQCICLANVSLAATRISGGLDLRNSDLMGGIWARGARISTMSRDGLLVEGRTESSTKDGSTNGIL